MNTNGPDLERTLADELRRRSDAAMSPPGMATAARDRARAIRRHRRLGAGVAVAAAAAILTPVALTVTSSTGGSELDPAQGNRQADDAPSTPLTLDGLAPGEEPSIGWAEEGTFHHPDGSTFELPDGIAFERLTTWATSGVVMAWHSTTGEDTGHITNTVSFIDSSGTTSAGGVGLALSQDGGQAAWFDLDQNALAFRQADGGNAPDARPVPADHTLDPIGFLDERTVISNQHNAEGTDGIRRDTLPVDGDEGGTDTAPWDLVEVHAVSDEAGLVVGMPTSNPEGVDFDDLCAAAYRADESAPLWETCGYNFFQFSPDGRYLLGSKVNPVTSTYVIADAQTGAILRTFSGEQEGTMIAPVAFEDDGHVLFGIEASDEDPRTAVVRCAIDGGCELATPIVDGQPGPLRYTLAGL